MLIDSENFGTTKFPIMGWLGWFSPHQSKTNQISTKGISIRIGNFPVQTPIDACPSLVTQHRYETPSELQVEINEI